MKNLWAFVALGAGAVYLMTRGKAAKASTDFAGAGVNESAGLHAYIAQLDSFAKANPYSLSEAERVSLVQDAASAFGVPPGAVWLVLSHESRATPGTGVFKNSATAAQAKNSSAFGPAQITRSRFRSERPMLEGRAVAAGVTLPQEHLDVYYFDDAANYVAASLARMADKWGQLALANASMIGDWWAGGKGAAKTVWDYADHPFPGAA